jgi:putative membrane protein
MLLLSVAIFVVARLMPGIYVKSFWTATAVAIVYSIINFLTGWFLVLITLPAVIITFGLFKIVINAFLLWVTGMLIDDFEIDSFGTTLIAAILIAIADSVLRWIF